MNPPFRSYTYLYAEDMNSTTATVDNIITGYPARPTLSGVRVSLNNISEMECGGLWTVLIYPDHAPINCS